MQPTDLIYFWFNIFQRYIRAGKVKRFYPERARDVENAYIKKNKHALVARRKEHLRLLIEKAKTPEEKERYTKLYWKEYRRYYNLVNGKKQKERARAYYQRNKQKLKEKRCLREAHEK